MTGNVDFQGASKRHYRDAELLMANKRIPNAGQLFGFAAECGIKALLVAYGLKTNPRTGDIKEKKEAKKPYKYKTHVNTIVNNIQVFTISRMYPRYLGMMPSLDDLESLGVIQYLAGGRIQMPDVYRIAFTLGRRGGVKPLR